MSTFAQNVGSLCLHSHSSELDVSINIVVSSFHPPSHSSEFFMPLFTK